MALPQKPVLPQKSRVPRVSSLDMPIVVDAGSPLHRKIAELLKARGNKPTPIRTIAAWVGASDTTVRKILAERHRDKFERVMTTDSAVSLWRLANQSPVSQSATGSESGVEANDREEEIP